jgi:quinol monooxygenase YgiN
MFEAILRVKTLPGKNKDVLEILKSLQESLNRKQDCMGCEIYKSLGEEGWILYLEKWLTKESMFRHIQSDLYRRVLAVMELTQESPQLSFQELANVKGIELVMELRKIS